MMLRISILAASLTACVTAPSDPTPAPQPQVPTSFSWQLSVDGAPVTCAALGVVTVRLDVTGGDQASCDETNVGGGYCDLPLVTDTPCSDGHAEVQLDGSAYDMNMQLESPSSELFNYATDHHMFSSDDVVVPFPFAHLDVSWSGSPSRPYYDIFLDANQTSGIFVPFAAAGTQRLLVPPGPVHLTAYFEVVDGGTLPDPTPQELDIDVPATGMSVAIAVP